MEEVIYIFDLNDRDKTAVKSNVPISSFVTGLYLKDYCGPDVETISIPDGIEVVGERVFSKNKNLKTLILPDSVVKIEEQAFAYTKSVEKIVLSKKIKKISDEAFRNCDMIKEVILPSGLESIGQNAFFCCENLTDIILPEGLRYIEESAFHNCASLKTINIPSTVSIIRAGAFLYSGIESITIANDDLFEYTKGLLIRKDKAGNKEVIWANHNVVKYSYIIPRDITSIKERAFNDCKELTMLQIHDTIHHISDNNHWTSNISIYCERDSYAHKYAIRNNIKTVLK